jgi:uncharacterized RDD family membrane protein YckC
MSTQFLSETCQRCKNKGFDLNLGLICKLTKEKKELTDRCEKFDLNSTYAKWNTPELENNSLKKSRTVAGGIRFANLIIDRLICFVITIIVLYAIMVNGNKGFSSLEVYFVAYLVMSIYYVILESLSGQTIGKLITQTMVVNEDNQKPEIGTIVGRTLCRFIPFNAFSFLGENASGWHDTITNTRVIFKNEFAKKDSVNSELLDSDLVL